VYHSESSYQDPNNNAKLSIPPPALRQKILILSIPMDMFELGMVLNKVLHSIKEITKMLNHAHVFRHVQFNAKRIQLLLTNLRTVKRDGIRGLF
jgi:hypothetical protein